MSSLKRIHLTNGCIVATSIDLINKMYRLMEYRRKLILIIDWLFIHYFKILFDFSAGPLHHRVAEDLTTTISLGYACKTDQQCMRNDNNSRCMNGVCDCAARRIRLDNACSAKNRGCHKGTFQVIIVSISLVHKLAIENYIVFNIRKILKTV